MKERYEIIGIVFKDTEDGKVRIVDLNTGSVLPADFKQSEEEEYARWMNSISGILNQGHEKKDEG